MIKVLSLIGKKAKDFSKELRDAFTSSAEVDLPVTQDGDIPHPKGGYYALDYETFKRLRLLKKEAWKAYFELCNWGRWARKDTHRKTEEPPLNPFWTEEIDFRVTYFWNAPLFNQFDKIPKHKREEKEGFDIYNMIAFPVSFADVRKKEKNDYGYYVETSGMTIRPIVSKVIRAAHLARFRWETPDYFDLEITEEEINELFDQVFGSD
jgi:hypothetical protein